NPHNLIYKFQAMKTSDFRPHRGLAATWRNAIPMLLTMGLANAEILLPLPPDTALYNSDVKGIVNDNDSAGSQSGIPALGNDHHPLGFSFNVSFTPAEADLSGTVLLIEIGGTANGVALALVDGIP